MKTVEDALFTEREVCIASVVPLVDLENWHHQTPSNIAFFPDWTIYAVSNIAVFSLALRGLKSCQGWKLQALDGNWKCWVEESPISLR